MKKNFTIFAIVLILNGLTVNAQVKPDGKKPGSMSVI